MLKSIGVERDGKPLVVVRTPPSRAAYHRFGNRIFGEVIETMDRCANTTCVVLTRHPEQREAIQVLGLTNLVVPEHAVDSRSLLCEADLVIGAGGTMTREAALMGVPTITIFAGEQSAVDRELECKGYLRRLYHVEELVVVRRHSARPRSLDELRGRATAIERTFVAETLAVVD